MLPDPWLKRWLPLVQESSRTAPVLEIGCGSGDDTATLNAAGLAVTAIDLSAAAAAATKRRVPTAIVECRDVREPFPVAEGGAGAVVASLTLHYFPWSETVGLVERIRRTLRPNGVFLCRLNSTEDKNFGATGHPVIERNYYLVDGQPKRFFDEASVDCLFEAGWHVLSKEHLVSRKYVQQKALWEVVLRRVDA
ncbi:class I SAM-dependent methyltransferase [Piscinibacter sakaiensis]|uniref:class I SAM-dependent methyltransferase n=1 Tax=Piscinibacter sakaiensis TaxID=1547922 RepID=UPI003AAB6B0A